MQFKTKIVLSVTIVSLAVIFSFASVLLSTNLNSEHFSRKFASGELSKFFVVGDVQHVLSGDLPQSSYSNENTSNMMMGLGAGAFGSVNRTGELMIFAGKAYVKSTDKVTNYRMEIANSVMTPFSVGLVRGARPTAIYAIENNGNKENNVDLLFQTLAQKHGRLFAVFGVGQFEEMDTSAIKLAPVYGESLLDPANKEKYYHNLSPITGRVGIFFGVVNNPSKEPPAGYDKSVEEKMFYVNPTDRGSLALQSHTHILITNNQTFRYQSDYSESAILAFTQSMTILEVNHLLTQSVLKKVILIVYDLVTPIYLTNAPSLGIKISVLDDHSLCLMIFSLERTRVVLKDRNYLNGV